jgi:acyl homoserine lactone synthase
MYTDDKVQQVKASLRLLPTTGPTLLADIFYDTLPTAVRLSSPSIWECTRLCIDDSILTKGSRDEKLLYTISLIVGLGDVAIEAGIETILGNFDCSMLRLYRQIGCDVNVLGSTQRYGDPIYLGSFRVTEIIVRKLKRRLETLQSAILGSPGSQILAA